MVLFRRRLVVVKLAQLVVVSPGNSNLFPPTVMQTQCVSVLWGASGRDCGAGYEKHRVCTHRNSSANTLGEPAKVVLQACFPDVLFGSTFQVGILYRLAIVCVDHGVGVVCAAVLSSNKVPSGLRITGTGAGRKTGWLGHGAGVGCNVMRLLCGKGLLLLVRPEAVAGDSSVVDVVTIGVRLDDMKMDGQRHCRRCWGTRCWDNFHPRIFWGNVHPRRCWGNCHPRRCWGNWNLWRWCWNHPDCGLRGNDDGECRLFNGAFEYFGEVNDGLLMGVAELGKLGGRQWVGEGLCQGLLCNYGCIDRGCFRHWALVWK